VRIVLAPLIVVALAMRAIAVPHLPQRLSDTGLFVTGSSRIVDPRNRSYSPQYPLWADGARKSRWLLLPPGSRIDTRDIDAWEFPVGTRLWKEFAFGGRKVETRLIWRSSSEEWAFASYLWNDQQTPCSLRPRVSAAPPKSRPASGMPCLRVTTAAPATTTAASSSASPPCSSQTIAIRMRRTRRRFSPACCRCTPSPRKV
jgi:hypothetical protein